MLAPWPRLAQLSPSASARRAVAAPPFSADEATNLAALAKALADPTRLRILDAVRKASPEAIRQCRAHTPDSTCPSPALAKHLRLLVAAGVLGSVRAGLRTHESPASRRTQGADRMAEMTAGTAAAPRRSRQRAVTLAKGSRAAGGVRLRRGRGSAADRGRARGAYRARYAAAARQVAGESTRAPARPARRLTRRARCSRGAVLARPAGATARHSEACLTRLRQPDGGLTSCTRARSCSTLGSGGGIDVCPPLAASDPPERPTAWT